MKTLRFALAAAIGFALAACGTPYGGDGEYRDTNPAYYQGTAYPRIVPAPAPDINGIPQNPGSGG